MSNSSRVICGNSKELLFNDEEIPQGHIDLTVTSPPYGNRRYYNSFDFNDESFKKIVRGLYRVTKDSGVVAWVVGDHYINGSETLVPFQQALYFKHIGFKVHDTMIYKKKSVAFPDSNKYYQSFEYMFVFVKGKIKTFNLIKDRRNKQYGRVIRNTKRRTDGTMERVLKNKLKEFGVRHNIWEYDIGYMKSTTDKIAFKHPAIFPDKLARDHILSWSNEGDIVLDPFCGSGTVGKMCKILKRDFIGIDISKEYCDLSVKRINNVQTQ